MFTTAWRGSGVGRRQARTTCCARRRCETIAYDNLGVSYTTWTPRPRKVFRLSSVTRRGAGKRHTLPRRADLAQPGWTYDENSGVLRVRHDERDADTSGLWPPFVPPSSRHFPLPGAKGRNLLLSWPTNFTGFVSEYTTSSPQTVHAHGSAAVVNGQFTITSTISAHGAFYRLRQF